MKFPDTKTSGIELPPLRFQVPKMPAGIDSRRLSRRIFYISLAATFAVQFAIASYVFWVVWNHTQSDFANSNSQWMLVFGLSEYAWVLFTPLLAYLVSKLEYSSRKLMLGLAVIGGIGFLFSVFVIHPLQLWQFDMSLPEESQSFGECISDLSFWRSEFISSHVHIFGLGVIAIAVRYWLQSEASNHFAEQMRQSVHRLRLEVLTNRLQPHFLFNTLNTISALTVSQPEKAQDVIGRLGELLRNSVDSIDLNEISLQKEYALVDDYLSIQKVRFGDRLKYGLDLPEDLTEEKIPAFLLQPLVENSVKHGLDESGSGSKSCQLVNIRVSARKIANRIEVTVSDDGLGLEEPPETLEHRFGLALTRERLRLQYGSSSGVDISSNAGIGFVVTLRIPCQEKENR